MSGLYMLFGTLIALGVLVTIHEFGHFWVARRCGVQVLRFSVGFGSPLWRWQDRHGTEFVLAAIPLGGYVKMLDGREESLRPEQEAKAFNHKPVGQRIAIVAAGPIANFLLAFVFFWLLAMLGTQQPKSVIGHIVPDSAAEQAGLHEGLQISAVDGVAVNNWADISIQLLKRVGDSGQLRLSAHPLGDTLARDYTLTLDNWQRGSAELDPFNSLGLIPWRPMVPALLSHLDEQGPAFAAGVQQQDLIVAIDGVAMSSWQEVVTYVQARPGQTVELELERSGSVLHVPVNLKAMEAQGRQTGYLGAGVSGVQWPQEMLVNIQHGPLAAVADGVARTWNMSSMTLLSIRKMLSGELSAKNLSGPISIAKVAGQSAESGLRSFLNFLAYLSISLGVLNLLPIPVLDGGHLLFYLVELITGRPVPESVQNRGMQIGITLVMCLMFFAVFNDLTRL